MSPRRRTLAVRATALAVMVALMVACQGPAATTKPSTPAVSQRDSATSELAASPLTHALSFALGQLGRTTDEVPAGRFPFVAVGDQPWHTRDAASWMAGFLPGQLWLAYQATGDRAWARLARARQRDLVARQHDRSTHDLGFVLYDSFGQQLRLTGNPAARSVLLRAARSLASRWVSSAKTLRSWNGPAGQVTVIVDNMVNLELLFWGARHGGPPRWRHIALQHALTTRHHLVRPNGSTVQAARFEQRSGHRVWRGNVGGLRRHGSTWARGQAWAVYGYTMAYRETHDPRMLAVARRTAGFALRHLPADGVPFWDYAAPAGPTPRDSSAGAVLSSAFLELGRIDPDAGRRATYRAAGLHSLRTLSGPRYLAEGSGARSVLLHAHNDPAYPDVGVPYGDYFFLEALVRSGLLPRAG